MKHGYGAGDMLLASVGALLSAATRAHDLVCRAGGDDGYPDGLDPRVVETLVGHLFRVQRGGLTAV